MDELGQLNSIKQGFSGGSHRPVGPLACPARFERATYALEALKMRLNNKLNNGFKVLAFGVVYTPRSAELGGTDYVVCGVHR